MSLCFDDLTQLLSAIHTGIFTEREPVAPADVEITVLFTAKVSLPAVDMPTFNDTWLYPTTTVPSISTGADHLDLHNSLSLGAAKACSLCNDTFALDSKRHANTHTQPPCANVSCPECTWLLRNRDSTCQKCAARFTCPSQEPASPSLELDDQPNISNHRTVAMLDDGYDGDDERDTVSDFQPLLTIKSKHARCDAAKSGVQEGFGPTA